MVRREPTDLIFGRPLIGLSAFTITDHVITAIGPERVFLDEIKAEMLKIALQIHAAM